MGWLSEVLSRMLSALSEAEPLVDCFLLNIGKDLSSLASTSLTTRLSGGNLVIASGDLVDVLVAPVQPW